MLSELSAGLRFIRGEKGLLIITAYFFVCFFTGSIANTLWLPFFKSVPALGAMTYAYVQACNVGGRLGGGLVQYRIRYPARKKFAIAITVYLAICFLDGSLPFWPKPGMMAVSLCSGFLAVNSYNIRISTTQSYVPDAFRGRFNGGFQMITTLGTVSGQLLAGALAEVFPYRWLIAGAMAVNLLGCLCIMLPGRRAVKSIYNRDV